MSEYLCALDAGTTGVTVVLFDRELRPLARFYEEFPQYYPQAGWVEHDAEEIANAARRLLEQAGDRAGSNGIAVLGITNQRETVVAFDRVSGEPLARAIVWQCRRTSERCAALKQAGHEERVRKLSGLTLDPYFSASKMQWLLEQVPRVKAAHDAGRLAFGTIDAFLVHHLSGREILATDPTNAARTMLYDIHDQRWSNELLELFSIPAASLPEVRSSAGDFGMTEEGVFGRGRVPIRGVLGDQQAALYGQGCFEPGSAKNTYGTGCFLLSPLPADPGVAPEGLLLTLGADALGRSNYVLEGSVFVGGAAVQWLRDGLQSIESSAQVEAQALRVADSGGVVFVPAFVGLGAPYWDPAARGAILGVTRGTEREHVARAALEAIAHQVQDLLEVFAAGANSPRIERLQVDGGAAQNDLLMQIQADLADCVVVRPCNVESTALGAAAIAAVSEGLIEDPRNAAGFGEQDRTFEPNCDPDVRTSSRERWRRAVACVRTFGT